MNMVKGTKRLKIIVMLFVLMFLVLACYTSVTYAASESNAQQRGNEGILDPFSLNVIMGSTGNGSSDLVSRPPIRISTRPVVRSYFRPPVVPI